MLGLQLADTSPRGSRPPVTASAGQRSGQTEDAERSRLDDETNAALVSLLPWGVSILFHVGLVLIAIFVIWSTITQPKVEDHVNPPEFSFIQEDLVLEDLPSDDPKPLTDPTTQNPQVSPSPTDHPPTIPSPLTGSVGPIVPPGEINGDGKPSPFDLTKPGGGEDGVDFIVADSAKRIVYVIDASGSLLDSMPFVIENLQKSIRGLKGHQSFTVIFSQGDKAIEVPPRGMHPADADHKQQAVSWINLSSGNVVPRGRSKPIVAIEAALNYKPEAIFLLSDNITGQGQFEINQERLLASILKANTVKTRINTIQFLYPDPLMSIGLQPTLEVISKETGGKYKFIDGHELGIQW